MDLPAATTNDAQSAAYNSQFANSRPTFRAGARTYTFRQGSVLVQVLDDDELEQRRDDDDAAEVRIPPHVGEHVDLLHVPRGELVEYLTPHMEINHHKLDTGARLCPCTAAECDCAKRRWAVKSVQPASEVCPHEQRARI